MAALHIETVMQYFFLLTVLKWRDIHAIDTYYMDDRCGGSVDLSLLNVGAIKLKLTSLYHYRLRDETWYTYTSSLEGVSYRTSGVLYSRPYMDCKMTIKTSNSKRFMLFFKNFDVESRSFLTNRCNDWLEVYENGDGSIPLISEGITNGKQLCGWQETDRVYESISSSITLRFHSDDTLQDDGFTLILTPFHYGNCYSDEYRCHNSRCIKDSSTCNGYNPCGDYSDCYLRGGAIAGIVIASLGVLTAAIVTVVCCIKKRRTAIKRDNVQVPVHTIHPMGQTAIQTHASYPGVYANYTGAQVNCPGYTSHVYSAATSTYPPTVPPSNPPPYYEHNFSK